MIVKPIKEFWHDSVPALKIATLLIILLAVVISFDTFQVVETTSGIRSTQQEQGREQAQIAVLSHNNAQNATSAGQSAEIANLRVSALTAARAVTVRLICHTENELVGNLRHLIIHSAKAGRVFNHLYHVYGGPSYSVRLRTAVQEARDLQPLDCRKLH